MKTKFCQSCHAPLLSDSDQGTEANGTLSSEYCIHCYQRGAFTNPFLTMEGMETHVRNIMHRKHEDEREIHYVLGTLPGLKRWQRKEKV
jgi:hypothetical protein